jgi:hypothetical protein
MNTMAKAILELEMPENCKECKFAVFYGEYGECKIIEYDKDSDFRPVWSTIGRRDDCPLKLVEDKEVE